MLSASESSRLVQMSFKTCHNQRKLSEEMKSGPAKPDQTPPVWTCRQIVNLETNKDKIPFQVSGAHKHNPNECLESQYF